MKKVFTMVIALFICIFAYTSIDAKAVTKCTWKKNVKTCVNYSRDDLHPQWSKITKYNKKGQKVNYKKYIYAVRGPVKEINYKYSKYNNLINKQTKSYRIIVSDFGGESHLSKVETITYKKRKTTSKKVLSYKGKYKNKYEVFAYKNGRFNNKKTIYTYNNIGKLKSDKNGNAYKYIRSYKKTKKGYKITKQVKYKYNASGNLILVK